jgi:FtsH-binding integral membrane protein
MSYNPPGLSTPADLSTRTFIQKVYAWMSAGLAVTGACGLFMASDPRMIVALIQNKVLFWGLMIAQFGLVIALSGWVRRMEIGTARAAFVFYSALTGVTMSVIFLVYTRESIASTFFITAGLFGAMSAYGAMTSADLTSMGSFMFMGLLGVILAGIVNWFIQSPAISWALSIMSVIIFTGLTAYDTQKLKAISAEGEGDGRLAIAGALTLYLDFINLFLSLLRLTGRRRE